MGLIDMVGTTWGRLTVVSRVGVTDNGKATWLCRCACGEERVVAGKWLRSGNTRSCGCLQREKASARAKKGIAVTHGRSKTPRELVKKLNGMLVQENIEKHITMIAGILNLETHQLRWSSAGHYPPAIIFEPNQPPKILNTSSFPLGLTEDLEVEEFECVLNRHARFIICSDGALEPFDGGLNEQFEKLVFHLQNQSFQAPEHVADDIAILSLRRMN